MQLRNSEVRKGEHQISSQHSLHIQSRGIQKEISRELRRILNNFRSIALSHKARELGTARNVYHEFLFDLVAFFWGGGGLVYVIFILQAGFTNIVSDRVRRIYRKQRARSLVFSLSVLLSTSSQKKKNQKQKKQRKKEIERKSRPGEKNKSKEIQNFRRTSSLFFFFPLFKLSLANQLV